MRRVTKYGEIYPQMKRTNVLVQIERPIIGTGGGFVEECQRSIARRRYKNVRNGVMIDLMDFIVVVHRSVSKSEMENFDRMI